MSTSERPAPQPAPPLSPHVRAWLLRADAIAAQLIASSPEMQRAIAERARQREAEREEGEPQA